MGTLHPLDYLIIIVALFYAIEGYANGLIASILDIVSFLVAFGIGLKLYAPFGALLSALTHIPQELTNPIGFVIAALLVELLFRLLQGRVLAYLRKSQVWVPEGVIKLDNMLGVIPGVVSGLVLIAFLLTALTVIPISTDLRKAITSATLGNVLVAQGQGFERSLVSLFGKKADSLLTFFTIEPEEKGSIELGFKVTQTPTLIHSENEMLTILNRERANAGLPPLVVDEKLREVARAHAKDMLVRGYFSHIDPDGKDPFDRMNDAGINYSFAGENLALSASPQLAMQGLMASKGHRENILSPNFHKVGIGAIDGGLYGEMFSQEFTD